MNQPNKFSNTSPIKKNHYSIRKFTVGTASIIVGSFLFFGQAHAEEFDKVTTGTVETEGQPAATSQPAEASQGQDAPQASTEGNQNPTGSPVAGTPGTTGQDTPQAGGTTTPGATDQAGTGVKPGTAPDSETEVKLSPEQNNNQADGTPGQDAYQTDQGTQEKPNTDQTASSTPGATGGQTGQQGNTENNNNQADYTPNQSGQNCPDGQNGGATGSDTDCNEHKYCKEHKNCECKGQQPGKNDITKPETFCVTDKQKEQKLTTDNQCTKKETDNKGSKEDKNATELPETGLSNEADYTTTVFGSIALISSLLLLRRQRKDF